MTNKIYSRNATPSGLIFMWQRMKACPIMKEVKNTKGTQSGRPYEGITLKDF